MSAPLSDALVCFGATGDLVHKKIFPALYAMAKRGALNVPVVGVASSAWSPARLRNRATDGIRRTGRIDERGRVVRPAEPAWTRDNELKIGAKSIVTQGGPYIEGLRDWVTNGERSSYVLTDEEFSRRVKPRSDAEMEADASFKLGVWFHNAGQRELASKYFERAEKLNPDDWNYHRQDWSFTPDEAGKKWMQKFQALDKPYYPPLEIKKP